MTRMKSAFRSPSSLDESQTQVGRAYSDCGLAMGEVKPSLDPMQTMKSLAILTAVLGLVLAVQSRAADWATYRGQDGPGKGKHIVFVTGDEEYRSEEVGPMLAKILAVRHGFDCTVLFALNPADRTIDPLNQTNIVGAKLLRDADMMVIFTRFRELPDDQMRYVDEFVKSGKPILGIRTATHAFEIKRNKASAYAKYDWQSKEWPGGFGQQVLGDTWVNHHGNHGVESTRGRLAEPLQHHPILKGVDDIWGPTDVYAIAHLPKDAKVLVWGEVLEGMNPTDKPVTGPKNDPMMPIIWMRNYTGETGKTSRVVCSTIGAAVDMQSEGLRRLLVNACYWGLGLEDKIPAKSNVEFVGEYKPSYFGPGKFVKGVKPADLELK
jgi:type 1 glutamine amidotransferase